MNETFINIIEEYKKMLTDEYIYNILIEKFPAATETQIINRIDKHRNKLIKQLNKLMESKILSDEEIKKYFDIKTKETKIKNLLILKNNLIGI